MRRAGKGPGFDVCMILRLLASRRLDPAQATDIYENIFLFPLIPADAGMSGCRGQEKSPPASAEGDLSVSPSDDGGQGSE
jgi:hypothetical protein